MQALTLPESVLVRVGDKSSVWRVKNNVLNQVELTMGVRDARTGNYEVRSGLAVGDIILRSPSSSFKEGQSAELVSAKPATAAAPAASAASASNAKGT